MAAPPLSLFNVKEGTAVEVVTLSHAAARADGQASVLGHYYHHVKGRSLPCYDPEEPCRVHGAKRVWCGYIAAGIRQPKTQAWTGTVLSVSQAMEMDFRGVYDRGQIWRFWRKKGTPKGGSEPTCGEFLGYEKPHVVIQPFDIIPVLQTAFGQLLIRLTEENWMPDRIPTPTFNDDAPTSPEPSTEHNVLTQADRLSLPLAPSKVIHTPEELEEIKRLLARASKAPSTNGTH